MDGTDAYAIIQDLVYHLNKKFFFSAYFLARIEYFLSNCLDSTVNC